MPAFYVLIPILGAVCAFLFAISLIPTKSVLATQLEVLEAANFNGPDKRKLSFERVFSGERRSILRRQLLEAGWYTVTPAQLGLRVIACGGIGVVLALSILRFVHLPLFFVVALAVIVAICATYAPLFKLNSAIATRKIAIQKALPDFLDMVATTVQAGLSVSASLAYAIDAAPGPLGDEIKEALAEMRVGRPRSEALKAAADRARQEA
ncbi:MAG: type II secretion system F family protein, partial [Candidatus Eremiobacteraeota bacterium]|nr:type II secretion system F family protein [Candidatus Eremiobacteraeota bacterium]